MPLSAVLLALLSAVIHAGWNLVARARRDDNTLLHVPTVTAVIGLAPALLAQALAVPFPHQVWWLLLLSAAFQAWYHVGLVFGYGAGEFTLVYPMARSLPVLLIALVDLARGRAPTPLAWIGMVLVFIGCALIPHGSLRTLSFSVYRSRAMVWVLVTALSTVGYSTVDKLAAEQLPGGPLSAAVYYVWQMSLTVISLGLLLRLLRRPTGPTIWRTGNWRWPALVASGVFLSYWLILWAYQLSARISYVVALRQFSIVIGVAAGAAIFKESAPGLRISASLVIVAGMIAIALSR